MVFGDAVIAITNNLANNGFLSYQPAAGVEAEVRIAGLGESGVSGDDWQLGIYDGTNFASFYQREGSPTANVLATVPFNLMVTNSVYFALKNLSGGAADAAYSAVQTK